MAAPEQGVTPAPKGRTCCDTCQELVKEQNPIRRPDLTGDGEDNPAWLRYEAGRTAG